MPATYVIKSWSYSTTPIDKDGTLVRINGRAPGLLSWILSLMGIEATVSLVVNSDKVIFTEGSLAGSRHVITPLDKTCSMLYGFSKPWQEALVYGIIIGALTFFLALIPGIIFGIIYYILNKRVQIGFTDVGGRAYEINFKRSVIEGQKIDEKEAKNVCQLIQDLVDVQRQLPLPA